MKTLGLCAEILNLICIYPMDNTTNRWIRIRNICFSISMVFVLALANIASIVFMVKNIKNDLTGTLQAGRQMMAVSEVLYTYFSAYILTSNIQKTFEAFQAFYDLRV